MLESERRLFDLVTDSNLLPIVIYVPRPHIRIKYMVLDGNKTKTAMKQQAIPRILDPAAESENTAKRLAIQSDIESERENTDQAAQQRECIETQLAKTQNKEMLPGILNFNRIAFHNDTDF